MLVTQQIINWPKQSFKSLQNVSKNQYVKLRKIVTFENFKELIRSIFHVIGQTFRFMGLIVAAPFFAVESIISRITRRPTVYKIGSEQHNISSAELQVALSKLTKAAGKIKRLEILTPSNGQGHLDITSTHIITLKKLAAHKIVLKNTTLPSSILEALETYKHYYKFDSENQIYERKEKIFHLILPNDIDDALKQLDDMVDQGKKAVNVYFYPSARENELHNALKRIGNHTLFQIQEGPQDTRMLLSLIRMQ